MLTNEYLFNNEFVADMTNYGNNAFSFYNGSSGTSVGTFVNNAFIFKNWTFTSGSTRFGFNFDNRLNTGAVGSGGMQDRFFNNILSISVTGGAPFSLGLSNLATYLKGNALFDIDENIDEDRGTNNMTNRVSLVAAYVTPGTDILALRRAGVANIRLAYDINGKARNVSNPDIGPVDFSSWGMDVASGGGTMAGTATISLLDSQISARPSQSSSVFGKIMRDQ